MTNKLFWSFLILALFQNVKSEVEETGNESEKVNGESERQEKEEDFDEIETEEFLKVFDEHVSKNNLSELSQKDALRIIMLVYSEEEYKFIEELDNKLIAGDYSSLSDESENLLFFKTHAKSFLEEKGHVETMSTSQLRQYIQDNSILIYLEKKMDEEDENYSYHSTESSQQDTTSEQAENN